MAIQSMMFSSTWQILESYLEDSPSGPRKTPHDLGVSRKEQASPIALPITTTAHQTAGRIYKPLPDFPDSLSSSPATSEPDSLANSPASSKTSAFSDEFPIKPKTSKEIRRRRTPAGAEPRPKNLLLTKSNGATNLPTKTPQPISATSNYDLSPSIESPPDLPPPPPPKMFEKLVPGVPFTRKPVQATHVPQANDQKAPSRPLNEKLEPKKLGPVIVGIPSLPRTPIDHQPQRSKSQPNEKPVPALPQPQSLPPRTDSLAKGASNFPNPKQGRRPAHMKSVSSTSQNKELPPKPSTFGKGVSALPKSDSFTRVPEGVFELPTLPSERMPSAPYSQWKSNAALDISKSLRAESPIKEASKSEASLHSHQSPRRPFPLQATASDGSKPITAPGPTRPVISRNDSNTSQSSTSSLTSSSLRAPFPQPNISIRGRPPIDAQQRALSRNQSNGSWDERSITPQPQYPTAPGPARTPSNGSVYSSSQRLEVPSRSNTPQTQRSNSPQPSISSLPGVPEVRSPLIAPELKACHFTCYTQHRPLLPSSNIQAPVLCMTCKQDSDQMWKCSWCCLRICSGCKIALGEMKGDLKKMITEYESGSLMIGQDRLFSTPPIDRSTTPGSMTSNRSMPPIDRSNTPASMASNRSAPRIQMEPPRSNTSASPFMGNLPRDLMVGPNRGPPMGRPNGPRASPQMNGLGLQSNQQRSRSDSNRSDLSFERMPPPRTIPPNFGNGKPLPPMGQPLGRPLGPRPGPGASFGDIPIGINMGNEMRRPMRPLPLPKKMRKAAAFDDEDDGEDTPEFDLGIDAGPGGMAAAMSAMKGLNPSMSTSASKPPLRHPAMGLGIGSLNNGRPKGLRERMLMT
ncbi:hypothetical protein MMC10_010492 [Thelotrema lepadinum]|nr:hypothetical protein [Thelotrema lepadinum]